jgi:hypothetical protein
VREAASLLKKSIIRIESEDINLEDEPLVQSQPEEVEQDTLAAANMDLDGNAEENEPQVM